MKAKQSLEMKVSKATKELLKPLPSVTKLISLLNEVGYTLRRLSRMDQEPANLTRVSLSQLSKALLADQLLQHSAIEVKVGVTYLLTEIATITVPDCPFDDGKRREVFKLLVSAFSNLNDDSGMLYRRRVLMLENVAKIHLCNLMLDFECDDLIKEMLQIFFRTLRDDHPDTIFTSMETIMTQILEKSESISDELITDFLSSMEKGNEHVSPIARRLAEKIFKNCGVKLKDCVKRAIKSMNASLDNYSEIVTSVCEGTMGQHDDNPSAEKLGKDVEGTSLDNIVPVPDKFPKSTMCNKKRKVSANVDDGKDLVGSKDWQLFECSDAVRKKHKNGSSPASFQNQNEKINTERVEATLEKLHSFSRARSRDFLSTSNSEDMIKSPSPILVAKGIWNDFMSYPLKVFGNPENEATTMEAVCVLVENLSLFGDEEAKLLVEIQAILSSLISEREKKTRLQRSSDQLSTELEECGNIANKLMESVGTLKMEYDDLETQRQELEMQMKSIDAKKKITCEKMEKASLEAEEIMSEAEEKEATIQASKKKVAKTDSAMDNLMSRFFAVRSEYHRATFH